LSVFFRNASLRSYLLIGALLLIPMVPLSVIRALLEGLQQYRFLMVVNLLTSPIWLAACGLAIVIGSGIAGVLLATLGVELLNIAALGWRAARVVPIRWRLALPVELKGRVQRYNLALATLILLDVIVWQRSELLFLGRFSKAAEVS